MRRKRGGLVAAVILVLFGAVDAGTRAVPTSALAFRAWEAMTDDPPVGAPFDRDKQYSSDHAYGDLANLGNLLQYARPHPELFTTDHYGFRNPPIDPAAAPPSILLLGSSFTAGAGVSDDETLTSQLARLTRQDVYNAAGTPPDLGRARAQIDRLKMTRGLVIIDHVEGRTQPSLYYPIPTSRATILCNATIRNVGLAETCRKILHGPSGAEVIARRLYRSLQDDRLLPNIDRGSVVVKHSRSGDTLLFLPEDVSRQYSEPLTLATAMRQAAVYEEWRDALEAIGLSLLVVLIPDKFTVYAPLFDVPEPVADSAYFRTLAARLLTAHIDTVDLSEPMAIAASDLVDRHEYLYLVDDTHWTPQGVRIAAEKIASALVNH